MFDKQKNNDVLRKYQDEAVQIVAENHESNDLTMNLLAELAARIPEEDKTILTEFCLIKLAESKFMTRKVTDILSSILPGFAAANKETAGGRGGEISFNQ